MNASTPTLTPFALENAQLLEAIATGEFKTKAALGAAQNRDPSNLSKTLKRLESEGYLDRSGLQLTAAGQAARLAIQRIDPAASPAAIADKADARGFAWIKVALIDSDPDLNPRKEFDDEKLAELTASVREKGVIQPILIRPARIAGKYLIVAGERRWRAAKLADLVEIPAMVRELSDEQALEIATIENVQRSDLTPLEEAVAFKKIIENRMRADPELALKDVKESIATAVNKTVRYVEQRVDLLELPPMLQKRLTLPDENPAHLNLKEARKEVQDQRARDREAKAKILAPDELLAMAEFYHAVANYPEKLEGWYYAQQLPVAVGFRAFEKGEVLDRLLNRQALYRIKGWKGDPRNFVREGYGYSKKEIDRQLPGFLGKDSDRVLRVQRIKVVGEAEAERIRTTWLLQGQRGEYANWWLNAPFTLAPDPALQEAADAYEQHQREEAALEFKRACARQAEAERKDAAEKALADAKGEPGLQYLARVRAFEEQAATLAPLDFMTAYRGVMASLELGGPFTLEWSEEFKAPALKNAAGELMSGAAFILEGQRRLIVMAVNFAMGFPATSGPDIDAPWSKAAATEADAADDEEIPDSLRKLAGPGGPVATDDAEADA